MKKIPLTKGLFALIDDDDYERVSKFKWCAAKSAHGNTFYAQSRVRDGEGRSIPMSMHRFILGITDSDIHVDHQDGDGLNNQRYNIVAGTRSDNMLNTRRHRRDETIGVTGIQMRRYSFFIYVDMLRKIKKEVKLKGFDSVSRFLRKLITDYFANK